MFFLGCLLLFINLVSFVELSFGNRKLKWLKDFTFVENFSFPKLSIVIAAKDEESKIQHCVESLLALDYPHVELIVVNDRSVDKTLPILQRLAQLNPSLIVETVSTLPDGWLGKNHALVRGFEKASGDWVLFSDGDVLFKKNALKKAVFYAETKQLDHMAVMPEILPGSFLYNLVAPGFTFYFLQYMKPWLVSNPQKSHYLGVGAFNLIRRETYIKIGTHAAIRLRPDEDIRLGELVKKSGARQEAILGNGIVRVQWYETFTELCRGLEKNILAGINYRTWLLFLSFGAMFFFHIFPTLALFFTQGKTFLVFALIFLTQIIGFSDLMAFYCIQRYRGLFFPLTALLYMYVVMRATFITLKKNGIEWRGTFYTLEELKKK